MIMLSGKLFFMSLYLFAFFRLGRRDVNLTPQELAGNTFSFPPYNVHPATYQRRDAEIFGSQVQKPIHQ